MASVGRESAKRVVFLMRHAETENHLKGLDQGGGLDSPLTERALEQARQVALGLQQIGFSTIITSKQGRALGTGEIVREVLDVPLVSHQELHERNKGDWEGIAQSDWITPDLQARMLREEDIRPPGGESYGDLVERARRVFTKCIETYHGDLLFVTHGNINRAFLASILDMNPALIYRIRQGFCASHVLVSDSHGRWYVDRTNFVPMASP